MTYTIPNLLTLLRIGLIPVFVLVYWLPYAWAPIWAAWIFIIAGITDWLDGYLARRLGQASPFGAFLDPVADKLIVATALVLLVGDPKVQASVFSSSLFAVTAAVIIGREITVSALREWMAELGERASVAVSVIGKLKTLLQIVAITMLVYKYDFMGLPTIIIGEWLLYLAAALTLWSMGMYLRAAWPALTGTKDT
ncbi:MAG: CDP-diacylglycerol--glycerol-3-phosphate 3-phosphatidyltransferase [Gammaproteobacteria bacterium]|nr:CDP-diacylglycerol--glycerol-3-phosphate 3-phosphatidyltransferase [Gammaproteobacteria bacterium]